MTVHPATPRPGAPVGAAGHEAERLDLAAGAQPGAPGAATGARLAESLGQIADCLVALGEAVRELVRKGDLQLAAGRGSALMDPVATPNVPAAPRPLLRVRDVAERFAVDERTIRRWRSEGRLPGALEVAGVVRWRAEDIDAWVAGRVGGET